MGWPSVVGAGGPLAAPWMAATLFLPWERWQLCATRFGRFGNRGQIAQLVEQRIENPCVAGSIPALATTETFCRSFLITRFRRFVWLFPLGPRGHGGRVCGPGLTIILSFAHTGEVLMESIPRRLALILG